MTEYGTLNLGAGKLKQVALFYEKNKGKASFFIIKRSFFIIDF